MKKVILILFVFVFVNANSQPLQKDSTMVYKKRVLETTEVDFLTGYYTQNGDNAAVTGGIGTEKLTDVPISYIISIPLNDDDVLTINAGLSAYSSASTTNIDPFDGEDPADPYQASSGASEAGILASISGSFSHSSDDRNKVWSANVSASTEWDYSSFGFGGSYTQLFNEKNTELSINGHVYLDSWEPIYPIELRPFGSSGLGLKDTLFTKNTIKGNINYNPEFSEFEKVNRNTYSLGLGFSQILHKNVQASLAIDISQQQGLLSTPFQRVYFKDIDNSYIEDFQLADAIEQLPDSRFKVAMGGRLNWYLNEYFTVRTFYRYYLDDWGISSHTASIEIPIKLTGKFTLYPSYRFYNQNAADYFKPYEKALSTDQFYTSDYDLSSFNANQFGFGISYTDIFAKAHIRKYGLKSIDLKYYRYDRNSSFGFSMITCGLKFVMD